MGRLSRAVRAQRVRRQEERRLKAVHDRVMDRINSSLRETLCVKHNFAMRDDKFMEDQEEICTMVSYAAENMELKLNEYFPLDGISLSVVSDFKVWLWSPMGEPIRHESRRMCEFVEQSLISCPKCRREPPEVIDLEQGPRDVEKGECSKSKKPKSAAEIFEHFKMCLGFESVKPKVSKPEVIKSSSGAQPVIKATPMHAQDFHRVVLLRAYADN